MFYLVIPPAWNTGPAFGHWENRGTDGQHKLFVLHLTVECFGTVFIIIIISSELFGCVHSQATICLSWLLRAASWRSDLLAERRATRCGAGMPEQVAKVHALRHGSVISNNLQHQ